MAGNGAVGDVLQRAGGSITDDFGHAVGRCIADASDLAEGDGTGKGIVFFVDEFDRASPGVREVF